MAKETVWKTYDIEGVNDWRTLGENYANAFVDGTREWRDELKKVDEDAIVWQPFPGSHSIGGILLHIADVEIWWIHKTLAGRRYPSKLKKLLLSDETKVDSVNWPTPPRMPLEEYYAILDDIRKTTLEILRSPYDPLAFHEFKRYSSRLSNRWILSHTLTHESYHGGQAVLLAVMYDKMKK